MTPPLTIGLATGLPSVVAASIKEAIESAAEKAKCEVRMLECHIPMEKAKRMLAKRSLAPPHWNWNAWALMLLFLATIVVKSLFRRCALS